MSRKIKDYQFIQKLQELSSVQEIWLFGSRARNDHQERSDIDLAILLKQDDQSSRLAIAQIIHEADTLLAIDITYLNDKLDPSFERLLNKDKILVYRNDS